MELRDKKRLKNTGCLPGFSIGKWLGETPKGSNMTRGNILGNAIPSVILFGGDIISGTQYTTTDDDMLMDAGQRSASVMGVGYQAQNGIDKRAIQDEEHKQNVSNTLKTVGSGAAAGASVGSIVPGVGTALGAVIGAGAGLLGGLFASGKRHAAMQRAIRNAEIKTNNINEFNRSGAITTALQLDYAKKYGDTRSQALYAARDGKISSSNGPVDAKATARVSNGEIIANKFDGTMYRVPGKKNNKDSKLAHVKDSDTIITNKYGLSDYVAATGDVEGAERTMKMIQYNKNLMRACNGKLPRFEEGWIPNVITSGLGMLGGLSQYLNASGQRVKQPNTYAANPYETRALTDLYSLQVNPYPILPELYNQYSKATTAIGRSGGLSGGLRALARLSATNNLQQNTAKLLLAAQEQNNAYRGQAAQAALNAGNAAAQRRMQANQFDLDYYSKAHAARQQGMQTGMYNMLNNLQQYYANDFKRRQFNKTYGLYQQDINMRKVELQNRANNAAVSGNNTGGFPQNPKVGEIYERNGRLYSYWGPGYGYNGWMPHFKTNEAPTNGLL